MNWTRVAGIRAKGLIYWTPIELNLLDFIMLEKLVLHVGNLTLIVFFMVLANNPIVFNLSDLMILENLVLHIGSAHSVNLRKVADSCATVSDSCWHKLHLEHGKLLAATEENIFNWFILSVEKSFAELLCFYQYFSSAVKWTYVFGKFVIVKSPI